MRVAAIQSCYLPWRGFFDFIAGVDLFVIYDDIPYSKGTWRNRNQVKTAQGLKWITVPIEAPRLDQPIDEVRIAEPPGRDWREGHRGLLRASLSRCPYFEEAMALWEAGHPGATHLSALNIALLKGVCGYLGIGTPLVSSREYHLAGRKTERLLLLMERLGARTYVSGPAARDYLDPEAFRARGLRLEYKTYRYAPYPQPWGPFEGAVTVLDLIANLGPAARQHLRSETPNDVAVP